MDMASLPAILSRISSSTVVTACGFTARMTQSGATDRSNVGETLTLVPLGSRAGALSGSGSTATKS